MQNCLRTMPDLDYCDQTIVATSGRRGWIEMDYASIEIQDHGGNWIAVSKVVNNLQRIGLDAVRPIPISRSARSCRRSKRAIDRDVVSAERLHTVIGAKSALRHVKVNAATAGLQRIASKL